MMKMKILKSLSSSLLVNVIFLRSHFKRQLTDDKKDSSLFLNRSNYRARRYSSSIVVGNYLYIDGGEIMYDDGNQTTFVIAKSTYSIDVSSSWTNTTVIIKQIDKTIDDGAFNYPALWPALDNSSFYSYNGEKSDIDHPIVTGSNKLYKFTSDGSGGGQWSEDNQSYTASSNFTSLVRVGRFANACGPDACYAVGGWRSLTTDSAIKDDIPAAGIVSFNLTSHHWYNDSLVGSVFTGPWRDGQLFFTDVAGSDGVLIALGGSVTDLTGKNSIVLSLMYVYIYDIATKSWYQQATGGDVPPSPNSSYCAVGLQDGNPVEKTYEIFIYFMQDVWVLSLPSFQWHRAGQSNEPRLSQSCSVAGRRQMIIIGGFRWDENGSIGDDWPLGLGVFDLSEMVFTDRYDADASLYTSPGKVKRWYAENGSMAKDISEDVKALFGRSSVVDLSISSVPIPTGARSSSNSSSSISSDSVSTGAIAGGVTGGVILLAAVFAAMWTYIRHRRRRRNRMSNISQPFNNQSFIPQPIDSDGRARCEADSQARIEESDGRARCEVDGQQIHETEAQQRFELH